MVKWREDVDGKRVQRSRAIAACKGPNAVGKREADDIATREIFDPANRTLPGSADTVARFIEQKFEPNIVARTRSDHYRHVLAHVQKHLGGLRLVDVRADDIYALIAKMQGSNYSGQTIKHVLAAVRRVFRHAKELGVFAGDLPTEFVTAPKVRARGRGALTPAEVSAIASKLESPYRELVLLLVCTGLRIGEALGLRQQWVNLTDQMRIVDGQMVPPFSLRIVATWSRGRWSTGKTEGSLDVVPIPAAIALELSKLTRDPLFALRPGGKPLDPCHAARTKLKPVLRELGLSEAISWHWLRHTLASVADEAGMSEGQRQAVLRHASPEMTRRYTHSRVDALRSGLDVVAGRVLKG